MSDIAGIDLGTTNSLIGVVESGFPILLADENGERLTPSVIHFPANGEPIVGRAAARARALAPKDTIYSIKRLMGIGPPAAAKEKVDYELCTDAQGAVRIRAGGREFSPEELSALILQKLKIQAEQVLGRAVNRAVITVPAYFNDAQRSATKHAGELAGFTVERIINEPTAAALAYGLERLGEKSTIAVYDFGGGTFDISILQLHDGLFQVLSTNGNTHLGGDDIDRLLLSHKKFMASDLSAEERARLLDLLVAAKHRLSVEERVVIELPFLSRGGTFALELTRNELEEVARPIVEQTRWHCRRALADAKLEPGQLDSVILVGGATRMPLVRNFVREIFEREPDVSQNPEEAVAIGATIQAGILSGAISEVVLLDVTPLSLGIETFGGLMNVIIPRNSTIPIKAGEMFTTAVDNQRAMSIKVLQGEREMARDNWKLGEFEIEFEPAPKGIPRVGIQFQIDVDGILHVLARDTKSGRERELALTSATDIADEAVETMLADSLEHAFDDMSERAWTEASVKAEELLRAVALILPGNGDLPATERNRIDTAVTEIKNALESRNLQRLQRSILVLDEVTQNLASRVLQQIVQSAPTGN